MSQSRTPVLAGLAAVLVVMAVVIAVVLTRSDSSSTGADAPGLVPPAALVTAREMATEFFSLDYRKANDDVNQVLALATGAFKTQYASTSAQVIAAVKSKKLVSTASIPQDGVAVEFAHGNQAEILVVDDVTRTIGTTTDSLRNRARVQVVNVKGHWLASGVNQVG
jgi:Mce-associated membrane protein